MTGKEKQKAIDALKISVPIKALTQEEFNDYIQTLNKVMDWLEQEPKIGHWIRVTDKTGHLVWECDKCGWQQRFNANFCPDCGAKMIEPQESEG